MKQVVLVLASLVFVLALSMAVSAQSCSTDADCPADQLRFQPWCADATTLVGITQTFDCSFNFCSFDFITEVREECEFGCEAGRCLEEQGEFTCSSDADCPEEEVLFNPWCSGDNVMNVHRVFNCENPGTAQSFCAFTVEDFIVEECSDCSAGACVVTEDPVCGNNITETGEDCDDGNTNDFDGCSSLCELETITCSSNNDCGTDRNELICDGNDVVEESESHVCNSPGAFNSTCSTLQNSTVSETCSFSCFEGACVPAPECGNGDVEEGEQCDDGNTDDNDGCSSTCQLEGEPECGNGQLEDGEECDDGNTNNGDGCSLSCNILAANVVCNTDADCPEDDFDDNLGQWCQADGVWGVFQDFTCENPGQAFNFCAWDYENRVKEECDDCSNAMCPAGPVCGNNEVETGEECDDGNTDNGDGCSEVCELEEVDPPTNTTITLFELGVLQLAAHDLFNVDRGSEVDNENGKLDLTTLFDHGDDNIGTGGEVRNHANLIVHSVSVLYGQLFLQLVDDGFSESEAKEAVLDLYLSDVASAYANTFNQAFPDVPLSGATTHTENLAYRTLHEILPGELELDGVTVSLFDPNIQSRLLNFSELQQLGGPIDGQFDDALRNITIFVPPSSFVTVDLLEADRSFGDQFNTDIDFDTFLAELEDGRYDDDDQVFRLIRRLFRKAIA